MHKEKCEELFSSLNSNLANKQANEFIILRNRKLYFIPFVPLRSIVSCSAFFSFGARACTKFIHSYISHVHSRINEGEAAAAAAAKKKRHMSVLITTKMYHFQSIFASSRAYFTNYKKLINKNIWKHIERGNVEETAKVSMWKG